MGFVHYICLRMTGAAVMILRSLLFEAVATVISLVGLIPPGVWVVRPVPGNNNKTGSIGSIMFLTLYCFVE